MSTVKVINLQHPSSASNNIVLDSSGNATMAGTMAMATPFAMRNRIINGAMEIAQRGTSITCSANVDTYTLDRFTVYSGGATTTATQYTGPNFGTQTSSVLNVAGATGNTSVNIAQKIESINVRDLAGKSVTLSYWVYQATGSTKTITVNFYTPNSVDNWSSATFVGTASASVPNASWTFCSHTFTMPSSASNGFAPSIGWIPILSGQSIALGNVQLEEGSIATPFERRLYGVELQLAQRYYQQIGHVVTTNNAYSTVSLLTEMRTSPTLGTPAFDTGTGATFLPMNVTTIAQRTKAYQNTNHSQIAQAYFSASAEL